jgi:DNA-binding response OmpR family regulator
MGVKVAINQQAPTKPRVLVVDDEPNLIELIGEVVGKNIDCWMIAAKNIGEARQILETQQIELLVTDVNLPDGDGMSLIPTLRRVQPKASAIVITGYPSMDGAINALRVGALDFVPKPFSADALTERVRKALDGQRRRVRDEQRLERLRQAVRRLNESRKVVSKKVDLLCNDLITAYGELARQLDTVRTQEGFRKFLSQAKDLEQLLCHVMDWLLRQLGYSNVAIWLASDDQRFELGAYMKYTIAGEEGLNNAMRQGIVPLAVKESFLHLHGEAVQETLTPAELDYLADQEILAINCTYLGESLAVVALFRDAKEPFMEDDAETLKSISPLFAVALASIVRSSDKNPFDVDLSDYPDDDEPGYKESDWWKHGGPPPF